MYADCTVCIGGIAVDWPCAVFCVHAHNSAAFVAAHRVAHVNELGQQSRKCLHKCLFCATGMDKQDKVILLTACVPMLEGF